MVQWNGNSRTGLFITMLTNDPNNLKITKANQLIEIKLVELKSRLKLREQKVVLAIIGQISPDDADFKDYQVSIPELVKMTGIKSQNLYNDISSICTRLMSSVITIKEPDNPDGFLMVTWFSRARYSPSHGHVEFAISPELKPYLLQVKERFTTYNLSQVIDLKSSYSIRLYELLRQFLPLKEVQKGRKVGFREIDLVDLREYIGVEDGRYPRYTDLRRIVLERSQKELGTSTDLWFDFEPIRKGRKVKSIKFIIRHNEKFVEVPEPDISGDLALPMDTSCLDPYVENTIRNQLPEIADDELNLIGMTYARENILEGLFDLMRALSTNSVKGDPLNYYMGILKKKRQEDQLIAEKPHQTTSEKLTDRSWDEDE